MTHLQAEQLAFGQAITEVVARLRPGVNLEAPGFEVPGYEDKPLQWQVKDVKHCAANILDDH